MNDDALFDAWAAARSTASVPDDFKARVAEGVAATERARRGVPAWARAALLLLAFGALLFRVGSTLALFLTG